MADRPKHRFPSSAASTVVAMPAARVGAPERAYLVILAGPQMGEMVKLEPGKPIVVGREEGVGLLLMDDGVSRQHARLTMVGDAVLLTDLGSRNGTFVNGSKVAEHRLADGDKIQIGVATTIKFTFTDNLEEEYQRRLLEAALRDPLTGVYNRRHFDERMQAEFAAARRHGTPLSLLVIDVDHFKQINDRFTHAVGDQVLRLIATILQANTRSSDIVARYGGEEFAIVSTEIPPTEALALAERIRERIERYPWNEIDPDLRVTISVGLDSNTSRETVGSMLAAADERLYEAKRAGRNRVVAGMLG